MDKAGNRASSRIGIGVRLRTVFRKECGFKSLLAHQQNKTIAEKAELLYFIFFSFHETSGEFLSIRGS